MFEIEDNIWYNLWHMLKDLWAVLGYLFAFIFRYTLLIVWTAWWLRAVNWARIWEALKAGAWAPALLLLIVAALVWSRLSPAPAHLFGIEIANFWWQLGAVGTIAAYTLLLGYLQEVLGWRPPEISIEPPAHAEDHAHDTHDTHTHAQDTYAH
jgi:hypothetical protein